MSESPNDLWSGLPNPNVTKGLTWVERDLLKVYARFRGSKPTESWILWRALVNLAMLVPLMGVLGGLLSVLAFVVQIPYGDLANGASEELAISVAVGVAVWWGVTLGFLVRDQFDLRHVVAGWSALDRVLLYAKIDRFLKGKPESDEEHAVPDDKAFGEGEPNR
jgi:hypothetical protein